jgi:phosphatidylglycerophosphate synthase
VRTVRSASLLGLAAQTAVLAALLAAGGLGTVGVLAGLAFGALAVGLLVRGLRRAGAAGPGPADRVTLVRAVLVGVVVALVAESYLRAVPPAAVAGVAGLALLLDAVDGRVARRTGTVSAVGARFDVEVDSALALALSLFVARSLGPWVVLLGALPYLLTAARALLPWLRRPAPPRPWCKVVAAVEGVVLVVVASGLLSRPVAVALLLAVAVLLAESFGREVLWLWRTRRVLPTRVPATTLGPVRG